MTATSLNFDTISAALGRLIENSRTLLELTSGDPGQEGKIDGASKAAAADLDTLRALLKEKQPGLFEVLSLRSVMCVLADHLAASGSELSSYTVASLRALEGRFPDYKPVLTRQGAIHHAEKLLLLALLQLTITEIVFAK